MRILSESYAMAIEHLGIRHTLSIQIAGLQAEALLLANDPEGAGTVIDASLPEALTFLGGKHPLTLTLVRLQDRLAVPGV